MSSGDPQEPASGSSNERSVKKSKMERKRPPAFNLTVNQNHSPAIQLGATSPMVLLTPMSAPTMQMVVPTTPLSAASYFVSTPATFAHFEVSDFDSNIFQLRDQKLLECIKNFMDSTKHNPRKGSMPSERVQNCIKQQFPQLYASVIGSEYANQWHKYIKQHNDTFELIWATEDGRMLPRIRLLNHTDYVRADQLEAEDKLMKERTIVECLHHYLTEHEDDVALEDFLSSYPLMDHRSIDPQLGNKPAPLPPRMRELVRIIRRYPEKFSIDSEGGTNGPRVRSSDTWAPLAATSPVSCGVTLISGRPPTKDKMDFSSDHRIRRQYTYTSPDSPSTITSCRDMFGSLIHPDTQPPTPTTAPAALCISRAWPIPGPATPSTYLASSGGWTSPPTSTTVFHTFPVDSTSVPDGDPHLFPIRESRLIQHIVTFLDSHSSNPHKGSVPSERVQNCTKANHADLYKSVVGAGYSNQWHKFLQTHADIFKLFYVEDERRSMWRVRLVQHTTWEEADRLEREEKKVKELHMLKCLINFLEQPPHWCRVDDFMTAYPNLPLNREWKPSVSTTKSVASPLLNSDGEPTTNSSITSSTSTFSLSGGDGNSDANSVDTMVSGNLFPPQLPPRGDFVRFVRRHHHLFSYDGKSFQISFLRMGIPMETLLTENPAESDKTVNGKVNNPNVNINGNCNNGKPGNGNGNVKGGGGKGGYNNGGSYGYNNGGKVGGNGGRDNYHSNHNHNHNNANDGDRDFGSFGISGSNSNGSLNNGYHTTSHTSHTNHNHYNNHSQQQAHANVNSQHDGGSGSGIFIDHSVLEKHDRQFDSFMKFSAMMQTVQVNHSGTNSEPSSWDSHDQMRSIEPFPSGNGQRNNGRRINNGNNGNDNRRQSGNNNRNNNSFNNCTNNGKGGRGGGRQGTRNNNNNNGNNNNTIGNNRNQNSFQHHQQQQQQQQQQIPQQQHHQQHHQNLLNNVHLQQPGGVHLPPHVQAAQGHLYHHYAPTQQPTQQQQQLAALAQLSQQLSPAQINQLSQLSLQLQAQQQIQQLQQQIQFQQQPQLFQQVMQQPVNNSHMNQGQGGAALIPIITGWYGNTPNGQILIPYNTAAFMTGHSAAQSQLLAAHLDQKAGHELQHQGQVNGLSDAASLLSSPGGSLLPAGIQASDP